MKLIFDIGANVGKTVDFFKNKSEKVVCFEANPKLVSFLKNKYNNTNVIVDNRGLSDKIEIKTFKISNADTISTFSDDWINKSRFTGNYVWNEYVDVNTTTLDNIIDEYGVPDFIKIDVEGYEYEVILGLTKLLDNTIFSFEWAEEEHERILKTVNYLIDLGYNNYGYTIFDDPSLGENIEWDTWENLLWHNDINQNRKEKWGMIYFKK